MFRSPQRPTAVGRHRWIAVGLVVAVLSVSVAFAQDPPAKPAAQAQPTKSLYVFSTDGGAILNFIKPDKTADFEATIAKLKEALAKSEKPERKKQAVGWKIFKASEPGPSGSVIYVSIMDPAVAGADYSVSDILAEAFPAEGLALYKTYSGAFGQPAQNILNLTLLANLGQ
jgi:hypothetical protein